MLITKLPAANDGMKAMLIEDCVMSTCATMTEDRSINGDININSKKSTILNSNGPFSPVSNSNIDPDNSASFGGGRLKFFKGNSISNFYLHLVYFQTSNLIVGGQL